MRHHVRRWRRVRVLGRKFGSNCAAQFKVVRDVQLMMSVFLSPRFRVPAFMSLFLCSSFSCVQIEGSRSQFLQADKAKDTVSEYAKWMEKGEDQKAHDAKLNEEPSQEAAQDQAQESTPEPTEAYMDTGKARGTALPISESEIHWISPGCIDRDQSGYRGVAPFRLYEKTARHPNDTARSLLTPSNPLHRCFRWPPPMMRAVLEGHSACDPPS